MMPLSRRTIYVVCALGVIAAGLLCRWSGAPLPPLVAKYAGAILWGALIYWVTALLLPGAGVAVVALLAGAIAASVELSQLFHTAWLDQFRRTTLGVLLLGRFFSWADIAAYLVGIVVAASVDRGAIR